MKSDGKMTYVILLKCKATIIPKDIEPVNHLIFVNCSIHVNFVPSVRHFLCIPSCYIWENFIKKHIAWLQRPQLVGDLFHTLISSLPQPLASQ